jgi:hydrogenase/urease accessory protein HupE
MIRLPRLTLFSLLIPILLLGPLFYPPGALAHEVRPAYLQIDETSLNHYDLTWRTPVLSGMQLPVVLRLPDGARQENAATEFDVPGSRMKRLKIEVPSGLAGKRIEFVGLQATITDVLVRVSMNDGSRSITIVHPSQPWIEIAPSRGLIGEAGAYLVQGIQHILLGVDHLLFLLGLLLIVKNRWMLLKTISAFTVAHSITLAVATLGYAQIPGPPLNAAIALSILFLGPEVIRAQRGESSFAIDHPWVVAFAFGLLHGFGFATGLISMGLPHADIPLALLLFNVGVEIGQLMFVVLVLLLERAFRLLEIRWPRPIEQLPVYALGSLGAFWTIQRVALMIGSAR